MATRTGTGMLRTRIAPLETVGMADTVMNRILRMEKEDMGRGMGTVLLERHPNSVSIPLRVPAEETGAHV